MRSVNLPRFQSEFIRVNYVGSRPGTSIPVYDLEPILLVSKLL